MTEQHVRVAIVGGGPAGLTAAAAVAPTTQKETAAGKPAIDMADTTTATAMASFQLWATTAVRRGVCSVLETAVMGVRNMERLTWQ